MSIDTGFDPKVLTAAADSIFDNIVTAITGNIGGYTAHLLAGISMAMAAAIPLYFIFRIVKMWLFHHQLNMMEFVYDVMIMAVLSAFTYGGSLYTSNVVDFVMNAGDELAALVIGSSGHTALTAMFTTMSQSFSTTIDAFSIASAVGSMGRVIMSLIALVAGFAMTLLFFIECLGYLLLAKLMSGILLSVGGLFICLAFFPVTRSMFFAWMNKCISYMMLSLLMTISISLIVSVITKLTISGDGVEMTLSNTLSVILVLLVSGKIVHAIPGVAASLSGASASNAEQKAGRAQAGSSGVMNKVGSAVMGAATGGASKVAEKAADVIKGIQGGIGKG